MNEITVVTPSIPLRAGYLRECIDSVAQQTLKPQDHIIVMDYAGGGPARTRNKALRAVETQWVAFLDDDDKFYPFHLEVLLESALANQADLVYPWFDIEGTGNDLLGMENVPFDEDSKKELLTNRNFIPVTVLVKTSLLRRAEGFPYGDSEWHKPQNEEWGLWCRLLKDGAKFHHLPTRSWQWRHHGANTSGKIWTTLNF